MKLLVYFVFCKLVVLWPGWCKACKTMPLEVPIHGKYLKNHTDATFTDSTESACVVECFENDMCQSINFENLKGICQLSISTRRQHPDDFVDKKDWVYIETKVESKGEVHYVINDVIKSGKNHTSRREESKTTKLGQNLVKNDCVATSWPTNRVCKANFEEDGGFSCVRYCGTGRSCQDYQNCGKSSGVYKIKPDNQDKMRVFCNLNASGGGWTTIQRRLDGSVDFYREWQDYKNGFGNLDGEFWLGLDNIHRLTTAFNMSLRVELVDTDENIAYAEYSTFIVAGEQDNYRLSAGGYSGTAGNSLTRHNGFMFTTKDSEHDIQPAYNCAWKYKGAWWYWACHDSNLNGQYLNGPHSTYADGVNWKTWKGYRYSARRAEMMVRPL